MQVGREILTNIRVPYAIYRHVACSDHRSQEALLDAAPTPATIVLVHGAFAESASWNGVIAELHPRGYTVISVANPLRGLQPDAAYLRSVLEHLSPARSWSPAISYGGSVMTEAADGARGVAALVYIASFNLDVGESTAELAASSRAPARRRRPTRCRTRPARTCTSSRTASTTSSPPTSSRRSRR